MQTGDDELQRQLRELFLEEVDEQLGRMSVGLERLAVTDDHSATAVVAELFRSAHSLKGAAQAVGSSAIAAVCHELEEMLAASRDAAPAVDAAWRARINQLVDTLSSRAVQLQQPAPDGSPSRTGGEHASPPRQGGSSASTVSPAPRGLRASAVGTGGQRLAGARVDTLLDQAGDLIAASYGAESVVATLSRAGETLTGELSQRRHETSKILRMIGDPQARAHVADVLESAEQRAQTLGRDLAEVLTLVSGHQKSLRSNARHFAEAARRARLVSFEQATTGLHRLVRELGDEMGKQVDLEVAAADVDVDRELVLMLREVLGHLVRNALDHGVELPAARRGVGKPARGKIRIDASLRNDGVRIVVSDDGRGVDEPRLRRAAAAVNPPRPGETPTLAEVMFSPGASTASGVSKVSGRGVGLDAVRTTVEAFAGTVTVDSRPGAGTAITLLLPLNLSTMRTLLVRTAGQVVAFPSASVRRLLPTKSMSGLDGTRLMRLGEELVPVVALHRALGWPSTDDDATTTGLVVTGTSGAAVLTVDEVHAEREVVLRTSSRRLAGVRTMLGTTHLDDGSVVLVLNPPVCVRTALAQSQPASGPAVVVGADSGQKTVLLAEDSLTTRELERSLLEAAGFAVVVAHDGQQAWEVLQTDQIDAVVSDVNMPRMDGIALCRAIRASSRLGSLPVVLVTSLHSPADRRAGLEAGADAYLTKIGFNRDELVELLERLL